jgi:hypothetical protein
VRIIQVSQVGQMLRTILFGELNFASALTLIAEASVDILQRTRSKLKWSAGGFREAFTVEDRLASDTRKIRYRYWPDSCNNSCGPDAPFEEEPH